MEQKIKVVESTTDYSKFKKLTGNRIVTEGRVNKIISSILNVGYITSPLIVNEDYEVIDGQGRLEALTRLKLPVEYIVHPGIGVNECIAMNINQGNWVLNDYIDSYCSRNNSNFLLLKKLIDAYPETNVDTIFTAVSGVSRSPKISIKDGTLVITPEQYKQAVRKLDYAYELFDKIDKDTLKGKGSLYTLVQVLIYCYDYPEVDKVRLKNQVIKQIHLAKPWIDLDSCFEQVEVLYNKNLSIDNKVHIHILFKDERARKSSESQREFAMTRKRNNGSFAKVAQNEKKHPYLMK